jgi:succinylglutamate desuccinylase
VRVEQLGSGDPAVAIVGGIHGDEPCGERSVEALVADPPAVREPVLLVVANELAIERGVRYVDDDLNRVFSGDPDADSHEKRLAARLADTLAGCRTLALHSTQSYGGPFALVHGVGDFEREVCPRLTIDAVVDTSGAEGGRIFDAVPETIELECGNQRSAVAAENAIRASREFLAATGVAADSNGPDAESVPLYRLGGPIPKAAAERYEVFARNFEEVAAGDVFAAADDADVVAEGSFYPVLMSAEGYEDVFGYRAERTGTLP